MSVPPRPPAATMVVGAVEIAQRLDVKTNTVTNWKYRHVMPEPRWTVSGLPAWWWPEVEAWARAQGPRGRREADRFTSALDAQASATP